MADSFDPYHNWLGIPRQEQPPDYYRLLGIVLFESDPDVIQNACDQRMSHLKAFATGPRAALSERLLNEVSRAAVCLLNPSKKRTYDEKLCARRERSKPVHPATTNSPRPVASDAVKDLRSVRDDRGARPTQVPIEVAAAPSVSSTIARRRYVRRRKQSVVALTVQLLLFGLVGLAAVCFVLWLVYPTHPLISFFERTVRPNSATPTDARPAGPAAHPTHDARNRTVATETKKPCRLKHRRPPRPGRRRYASNAAGAVGPGRKRGAFRRRPRCHDAAARCRGRRCRIRGDADDAHRARRLGPRSQRSAAQDHRSRH